MARPLLVASVDVEGSILVIMMARRVGFATLTSEFINEFNNLSFSINTNTTFSDFKSQLWNS